jgi:hypothetical protein
MSVKRIMGFWLEQFKHKKLAIAFTDVVILIDHGQKAISRMILWVLPLPF